MGPPHSSNGFIGRLPAAIHYGKIFWAHALEVLRRYEPCSSSAERYVAVFEILFDRVPRDFERRRRSREEREKRERTSRSANTADVDKPE
jgi:hypothetical protein